MKEVKIQKKLVGDIIEISAYDVEESLALPILEEAYEYALKLQKIFSFYDEKSELSLLNKKRSLVVSANLLEVVSKALEYSKQTSGEYDISLGKQIMQRKSGQEILSTNCSYKDININGNKISLLHDDALIDLGSIAKGYIVDKIVEFLIDQGINSGFVNARGDMRFFGDVEETIEIQHPRIKEKTILPFKIKESAIATSGDYLQFYKKYEYSHILNQKDIISATVIAPDATQADVFASILFVTDKKIRENILKKNPHIKALLIDKKLKQKEYNGFSYLLTDKKGAK